MATTALVAAALALSTTVEESAPPFALVAVGDWGGEGDGQPATAAQIADAKGMSKVASELNAAGILLLGDNFYFSGVNSVESSRFKDTFEDVYPPSAFKTAAGKDLRFYHDLLIANLRRGRDRLQ